MNSFREGENVKYKFFDELELAEESYFS